MLDEKSLIALRAALTEYLRVKKLRKTPERFAILDKVAEMNRHFDIDTLYAAIDADGFHVSRATTTPWICSVTVELYAATNSALNRLNMR